MLFVKPIEEMAIDVDSKIERIGREISLLEETYYFPKISGVVNLFVPKTVKGILLDRLIYLQGLVGKSGFGSCDKVAPLLERIRSMKNVIGFTERGIVKQVHPNGKYQPGIDLAKTITKKHGLPFFAWEPGGFLVHDMGFLNPIGEEAWLERSTGSIDDSRGDIAYGVPSFTVYTKLNGSMSTHGLSFCKKYVNKGSDTRLSFDCGYNFMDGFMYSISFHLKDGKLQSVTDGRDKTDIRTALDRIQNELSVTPQHLLYYIEHSNLTETHLQQIADVLETLRGFPKMEVGALFSAQKPKKRFYIVGKAKPEVDHSAIDMDSLHGYYDYVSIKDISTDELRQTHVPDKFLSTVVVEFTSGDGKRYNVWFHPDHPDGPYFMLVSGGHKERADFDVVYWLIMEEISPWFGVIEDKNVTDRTDDLCVTPHILGKVTQESIADVVDGMFKKHFTGVRIVKVMFQNVPEQHCDDCTLGNEKLHAEELVLAENRQVLAL